MNERLRNLLAAMALAVAVVALPTTAALADTEKAPTKIVQPSAPAAGEHSTTPTASVSASQGDVGWG